MSAKILLLDIETAPTLAYVWGAYQQDIIDVAEDWHILSYAWKWLEDKTISYKSLYDCPAGEQELIEDLWELFDTADVIVAHNGDSFDIKKCNAMFLRYGLKPPRPYKTVDTRKIARKYFRLDKNTLADIGRYLGFGGKEDHLGFKTWLGCMNGDPEAWSIMKGYNIRDVELLEKVYLTIRPWHSGHPNLNLYSEANDCPTCGSHKIQRRGYSYAKVQIRQRFHCTDCGAWWSGKVEKKSVL